MADREGRDRRREEEDAVWAQLVESFGEEPAEGASWPQAEELGDRDPAGAERVDGGEGERHDQDSGDEGNESRSFVVRGAAGPGGGPRDYELPEDDDAATAKTGGGQGDGEDEDDEGHFVPPPPPPLPKADTTTKFAWLAALGGPLLLILMVAFQQELAWWVVLLGVGGFLGGFGTLVARMKDRGEDDDDPHGGAVV